MLISVIVPVYNAEKYIQACADSILSQSHTELELILIDDGSTDTSPQICDDIALKDSRVKVFHQKNGGVSNARNRGIEVATGEYIIFVDNDDLLPNNSIKAFVSCVISTGALVLQGKVCTFNNPERITLDEKADLNGDFELVDKLKFVSASRVNKIYVWGKMFNRRVVQKIKFPEGHYGEDVFFNDMVISDDDVTKIAVIDKCVYYQYENPSSASRNWSASNYVDVIETVCELYKNVKIKTIDVSIVKFYLEEALKHYINFKADVDIRKQNRWEYKSRLNRIRSILKKDLLKVDIKISRKFAYLFILYFYWFYLLILAIKDPTYRVNSKKIKRNRA